MKAQRVQNLDWSDVPYVLSVCEAGSLAGAARMMGVNHSTVFRRIAGVEDRLGVRLFDRQSHGYVMTPAGELFYQRAIVLCDGMNSIEMALAGKDLRLEGKLTVTTTDSLLNCLTPVIVDFQKQHPDVELRILSDAEPLDLMQRDADIALRPTQNPPEHWVGRKLLPIICAAYAHRDYWAAASDLPPEQLRWVLLDDSLNRSPMSQIAKSRKSANAPTTTVNTVMGALDLTRSGLGIAVLPTYLAEKDPQLVRIGEPDDRVNWDLWVLAHPDVRRSARVHAFFDHATSAITEDVLAMPSGTSL
ncbi:LysR family transcriptional regulator [Roseibium sp. HPY-6]|uniref:LysR family transcriptional regulator n=1 Tax=Roseibium sp. HPY-6 TaxID=3229852 RepID=UPI00338DFABC